MRGTIGGVAERIVMLKTQKQREARQQQMRERMQAPLEVAFDEHFTVQELAARWKLSRRTVQRIMEKELDVVRLGEERSGKRRHVTLRIPASVARRVYLRLTGKVEASKKKQSGFKPCLVKRSRA
jgi:AraC-like DNA-binding protein